MIWLIQQKSAYANTMLPLPDWPIEGGWSILLIAAVIWISLGSDLWPRKLKKAVHFAAIALSLLGLGAFLGETSRKWLLLAWLIGIGWSLKDLGADLFYGLLLKLEGRSKGYIEAANFAGKIESVGWRNITLLNEDDKPLVVPTRLMMKSPVKFFPPGQIPTTLHFWLPEGMSFHEASECVIKCLSTIPWIANPVAKIAEDTKSPYAMRIELNLLRIEDKGLVQQWIGQKLQSKAVES